MKAFAGQLSVVATSTGHVELFAIGILLLRTLLGLAALLALVLLLGTVARAEPKAREAGSIPAGITFRSLKYSSLFPEAINEKAIQFACAEEEKTIALYFLLEGILFHDHLVRRMGGKECHILYRSTVPGFRAHAESDPVEGILFTFESRGFLGQRKAGVGDSLDMAKAILRAAPGSLGVSIRARLETSPATQQAALAYHFGKSNHRISLMDNPATREMMWAQDYIKSGSVRGEAITLVPRRTFEGNASNGALFRPLLDALEEAGAVRSKLSWDGGDLLFVRDPRDATKLVLFYGGAAKPYWAGDLSAEEYEYVLKAEFSADAAVYAGGIVGHVDYAVNFLSDGKTALLARPTTGNFALSDAAIRLLVQEHGELPPLRRLRSLHADRTQIQGAWRDEAIQLLRQMATEYHEWPRSVDVATMERAQQYAKTHCPEDYQACSSATALETLMASDPDLARDWLTVATSLRMGEVVPRALIGIIASQLATPNPALLERIGALRTKLEDLGFQVVDVPLIAGNAESLVPWAGISYSNFLALEDRVFMPRFGLGGAENEMLAEIQRQLPQPYQIVPVYARYALAANGGVHCISGVLRQQSRSGAPAQKISSLLESVTKQPEPCEATCEQFPLSTEPREQREQPSRF